MDTREIELLVQLEDGHWWYQERRYLVSQCVRRLPPGRAVDVGAAGGGNARALRALGWAVTAVEVSRAGTLAASRRGIPVVQADARRLPMADGSVDLALSFDVFEHIAQDDLAAGELARVLRPGGTALVAVPADPRLWSAHDEAVGHLRRYTRDGLTSLLEGAGLQIDRLWSWNVLLRPLVALRRRRSTGSDLEPVPSPLNAAFRATVACERLLPVGRLSGVTLLAVARH